MPKKDDKDKEKKVKSALKAHDEGLMLRKAKAAVIAGDMPYNREAYISTLKFMLRQTAESVLIMGKMLLVMKENEPHGEFMRVVEEEVGLKHSSAANLMRVALAAEKHPQIEFNKFNNVSNVYALLEAPEEELKELEQKGVLAEFSKEELYKMPYKKMKELIEKLKNETDKIVKAEVKTLETEKKALVKEVERLKAFDPEGKDASWAVEQMKAVDKIADEFDATLRRFVKDPRILDHPEIQAKVEAVQARMEKRFQLFIQEWNAFVNGEAE